ncbi:MAG TPA: hypothetical protein PKI46_10150 [Bacteroidales bacterium]|nr:hypothetical protein [Bacteroidales bacterium]
MLENLKYKLVHYKDTNEFILTLKTLRELYNYDIIICISCEDVIINKYIKK